MSSTDNRDYDDTLEHMEWAFETIFKYDKNEEIDKLIKEYEETKNV